VVDVDPSSRVLHRFIEFPADDITNFQPGFAGLREDHLAWMVLRDGVSVGAVVASKTGPDTAHLELDYVVEAHRDLTPGTVLFSAPGVFPEQGIRLVTSDPGARTHCQYLERMGFRAEGGRYVRTLPD
jgi:hypothetical protein